MYQFLMRANRYTSIFLAGYLLVAFAVPELQTLIGIDSFQGLQIYTALLAGMMLADKQLAKLSFAEVCREMAGSGETIEELQEKFWREELERRRQQGKQ